MIQIGNTLLIIALSFVQILWPKDLLISIFLILLEVLFARLTSRTCFAGTFSVWKAVTFLCHTVGTERWLYGSEASSVTIFFMFAGLLIYPFGIFHCKSRCNRPNLKLMKVIDTYMIISSFFIVILLWVLWRAMTYDMINHIICTIKTQLLL